MDGLVRALRRAALELDVPAAARPGILLEMAADLEAVYEHHRRRGSSDAEAAEAAERAVLGSPDVIRSLARLHRSSGRAWWASVGARLGGGVDLLLVAVVVAPMLALSAVVGLAALAGGGGPFLPALVAVGVAQLVVVASESRRLVGGGAGRPGRLALLPVLSALAVALGLLGLVVGLYATATTLAAGPLPGSAAVPAFGPAAAAATTIARPAALVAALTPGGGALLLGLVQGLAGGLSWFVLVSRSSLRLAREVEAVLEGSVAPVSGAGGRGILALVRRRSG